MKIDSDECDEHIQDYKDFGYDDDIDLDLLGSDEIYELINKLCNTREIKVVNMIYIDNMTLSQVANCLKISTSRVTQIRAKAFRKIRREISIHKIKYISSFNNISSSG